MFSVVHFRKRIIGDLSFAVLYGLCYGVLMGLNIRAVHWLGYLIMWLAWIIHIVAFCWLPICYFLFTGRRLNVLSAFCIGFLTFLIALAIYHLFENLRRTIVYMDFGWQELREEWIGFAAGMAALQALIFAPAYIFIRNKRKKRSMQNRY